MTGIQKWNDRSTFSIQDNNGIEAILRKAAAPHWLETCGPTSAVNILDAHGYATEVKLPGGGTIQPEDALAVWMNDIKNADAEKQSRPDVDPTKYLDNEIPQYYPLALKAAFGAAAKFLPSISFDAVCNEVRVGHGVMICLKNPGHFLGVVAFDEAEKKLIYRDPWPERTGTDGFNLRMGADEFALNVAPFAISIYPPGGVV